MKEQELYEQLLININSDNVLLILEIIGKYFHMPVMIVDGNYNLISHYSEQNVEDELWNLIIANGYVPFDYAMFFKNNNMIKEQKFEKEPKYYTMNFKTTYNRIISSLYVENELFGYFALLTNECEKSALKTVKLVSQYLTKYLLSKNYIKGGQNEAYRVFLTYLFEDRFEDEQQFKTYCDFLMIDTKKKYVLLSCIVPPDYNHPQLIKSLIKEHRKSGELRVFYYQTNMYILSESKELRLSIDRLTLTTKNRFGETLYVGYSEEFQDFSDIKRYKQQADLAAEYASRKKEHVFFATIISAAMADCIKTNMSEMLYRGTLFSELKKYDHKNQTEYYETLKNYVYSGCQLKETSIRMKVHRNTIVYRLRVIEEKYKVQLSSIDILTYLYLNFKIEDLSK